MRTKLLAGLLEDLLLFGGVAVLAYGVSLVSTPAAFVVVGLAMVSIAVALHLARKRVKR